MSDLVLEHARTGYWLEQGELSILGYVDDLNLVDVIKLIDASQDWVNEGKPKCIVVGDLKEKGH